MKKYFVAAAVAVAAAQVVAADSAWYVGADLGNTNFKQEDDKANRVGFGATVGYRVNENVALELQARRLGRSGDLSANAVSASVLGILPLENNFSLYARLGYGRNSLELDSGSADYTVRKSKALFGLGASYAIDKNWSVRAEYVNLGKNKFQDGQDSVELKMQQFNLGVNYAF